MHQGLVFILKNELLILGRNARTLLSQVGGLLILWTLFARQVKAGAHEELTGYFLLLLIVGAIGAPVTVASHAFVGEKQRRTLESLLLLPLPLSGIIGGKLLAACSVAVAEIFLTVALAAGAVVVFGQAGQVPFVLNAITISATVFIAPLFSVLFALVALIVSTRAKTTQEAVAMAAFVAAPVLLVLVGIIAGAFSVQGAGPILGIALLVLIAGLAFYMARRMITVAALLKRP